MFHWLIFIGKFIWTNYLYLPKSLFSPLPNDSTKNTHLCGLVREKENMYKIPNTVLGTR